MQNSGSKWIWKNLVHKIIFQQFMTLSLHHFAKLAVHLCKVKKIKQRYFAICCFLNGMSWKMLGWRSGAFTRAQRIYLIGHNLEVPYNGRKEGQNAGQTWLWAVEEGEILKYFESSVRKLHWILNAFFIFYKLDAGSIWLPLTWNTEVSLVEQL